MVAEIGKLCSPYGPRLVIDAAGAPEVMHQAVQVVQNEGIIVRIGKSPRPYGFSLDDITCKSVTLRGHEGYNTESWQRCIALATSGQLNLSAIITQHMPLKDFDKGFELMRTQQAAKVMLMIDEE